MEIQIYQVDAFTNNLFQGNPAAVCPLNEWLEDFLLQSIAAENNLSETAFFVYHKKEFELRWFTPTIEVDLCGHATLATAHIIFNFFNTSLFSVSFKTVSGILTVKRQGSLLSMDFPARKAKSCAIPDALIQGLKVPPSEVLQSRDYLVVYNNEEQIKTIEPDFERLKELEITGIIITAPGNSADFVSRFFAPKLGIPEDPVTGSAHCTLVPYWSERLNKKKLHAFQLSKRGGELFCEDLGERIKIAGKAVTYLKGVITI